MSREREVAFTAFVQQHQAALLRTAYLVTGQHAAAEGVVQAALLKTYTHWDRIDVSPLAFARRVVVNTHTSWRRLLSATERPVSDVPDRAAPRDPHPDDRKEEMMAALRQLPPRMRAVVVLRFYEDLSEAETARLLGCSVGTVKTQSSRGLARLRQSVAALDPSHCTDRAR
ncbi:SigE family RNA polymerase sigma factor [Goekera deserti]|uniref:SigE family RNA polymerase sigma factor n=1 Tax=Goekera deserti TaxID=2497753 RepID=UPI001F3188B9|nr:SigE family RNA polymerase sigma factor [Goekera deserti]